MSRTIAMFSCEIAYSEPISFAFPALDDVWTSSKVADAKAPTVFASS
jgi:hypothetical protein